MMRRAEAEIIEILSNIIKIWFNWLKQKLISFDLYLWFTAYITNNQTVAVLPKAMSPPFNLWLNETDNRSDINEYILTEYFDNNISDIANILYFQFAIHFKFQLWMKNRPKVVLLFA